MVQSFDASEILGRVQPLALLSRGDQGSLSVQMGTAEIAATMGERPQSPSQPLGLGL